MQQDTPKSPWGRASPSAGPVTAAPEDTPPDSLTTQFVGRRRRLFWLALKTGGLTVLTLGCYRFWMKSRLRRWYWSSIRIGGLPLEYTGTPLEKLLGFLIAVVILAFYIGVVNLLLMFASFSLLQGNTAAYLLSFVGVIPIWFYAQYRARRYVLARTRWRGLRFGLEPGAWGYAFRALGHWLLTLCSLGLLWPRMTFKLEQYRTNRTFFGDHRMQQGGRWTMLYPGASLVFVACLVGIGGLLPLGAGATGLTVLVYLLAGMMLLYGVIRYRVRSLILLTRHKTLDGVGLTLRASPGRVLWIYVAGYTLSGLCTLIPLVALLAAVLVLLPTGVQINLGLDSLPSLGEGRWLFTALGVGLYFSVFLLWSASTHALVTMPLLRHYAQGLTITGPERLGAVRQRPRDPHEEAEGFAEALDVGASI